MAAREAFGPRRRRMAGKDSARRTPGIIRAAAGAERDQRHLSSRAGVDVATKRQVETKLRQLIKRLDQADHEVRGSLTESLPEARIIEVVITDLGNSYWTELTGSGCEFPAITWSNWWTARSRCSPRIWPAR